MLNRSDLKDLASIEAKNGYVVSLYLNVDPLFNKKGDYSVHFKNMLKNVTGSLDKAVYKTVKEDLEMVEHFVVTHKRAFKKGLVIFSSKAGSLWKEYHLGVPVRNELIVDKTPHTKPLHDVLDTYEKYAVVLVGKESARIFAMYLGEIVEYGEVHTADIPGKHKKGGWFALAQNHYERHIDYHVGLHLREVIERLETFLATEQITRVILSGSDEAVAMVKGMLHKTVLDKVIGHVKVEMFAKSDEVMAKSESVVAVWEKAKEEEMVSNLMAKAMKNESAVLGLDNVLSVLQEQRVMRLVMRRGLAASGYSCTACGALSVQRIDSCPYCKGAMEMVDRIVNLAGEKAIQQGAVVEVVEEDSPLKNVGGIGAFLRY